MPKPACPKCQLFYTPKRNGYWWVEGMPLGHMTPPGVVADSLWKDYKIWCSDLWECRGCGAQVITGHDRLPLAEQHQLDFEHKKSLVSPQVRINDC